MEHERNSLRWFAVHTRSRHEGVVTADLAEKGFETFLPRVATLSRRRDRRKILQRPLFAGYLFVRSRMTGEERIKVLDARGLVRILLGNNRPVPIPDREIESIRILAGSAGTIEPYPYLNTGALVSVVSGPLAGVVGRVVDAPEGRRKIVCSVEILGRSVAAELDREWIVMEQ